MRDVENYQNMADEDIAVMLFSELGKIGDETTGNCAVETIVVDQDARRASATATSNGSVRRFNARLLDASLYEKVVYYAFILGFKVTASVARHRTTKEAYIKLTFVAINDQGTLAAKAGDAEYSYKRGDGEVIDFSRQYDPPGNVIQRNVNSKRFDPLNETFVLENTAKCVTYDKSALKFDGGDDIPPGSIRGQLVPTDSKGKPLTLAAYTALQKGQFGERIKSLGMGSTKDLWAYHNVIAYRKGANIPGAVPGPVVNQASQKDGRRTRFRPSTRGRRRRAACTGGWRANSPCGSPPADDHGLPDAGGVGRVGRHLSHQIVYSPD